MEKEYTFEDANHENKEIKEPAIEYGYQEETEMELLPPLTEEELKGCITGDELIEAVFAHIDKLFANKK